MRTVFFEECVHLTRNFFGYLVPAVGFKCVFIRAGYHAPTAFFRYIRSGGTAFFKIILMILVNVELLSRLAAALFHKSGRHILRHI